MSRWNTRNPAVKRIVQELREIGREDDPDILAEAIEDNIFEWHFAIRGAWDSEFEGGIYHGRILMPAEYPFKPPAFVMLTPSGRFETGTKICLSISSHHPESWQPSWSVRSALVALIAFMQTPGNGALGSLDHPPEVRRELAAASRAQPPTYGAQERQELINSMHQRMLDMEERSRAVCKQERAADTGPAAASSAAPASSADAGHLGAAAAAAEPAADKDKPQAGPGPAEAVQQKQVGEGSQAAEEAAAAAAAPATTPAASLAAPVPAPVPAQLAAAPPPTPAEPAELRQRPAAAAAASPAAVASPAATAAAPPPWPAAEPAAAQQQQRHQLRHARSWEDRGLTYLAALLALCISALVIRKMLVAFKFDSDELYNFNHVEGVEL